MLLIAEKCKSIWMKASVKCINVNVMVFMSILISDYIVFTLFDALVQFFILIQLMLQHHILGMHGYGQSIQYMEIVSVHKYIIHKYYTILNSQTNVYFTERAG